MRNKSGYEPVPTLFVSMMESTPDNVAITEQQTAAEGARRFPLPDRHRGRCAASSSRASRKNRAWSSCAGATATLLVLLMRSLRML
jgi:hypothetical protein